MKKRFYVSAVALNDGNLGPHQMEMGHRYDMCIIGTNADKIEADLGEAGFQVLETFTAKERKRQCRVNKQQKSSDAAAGRSRWAVFAKHYRSKARHVLHVPADWYVDWSLSDLHISQYGEKVLAMAQDVVDRMGCLSDQRIMSGDTLNAHP